MSHAIACEPGHPDLSAGEVRDCYQSRVWRDTPIQYLFPGEAFRAGLPLSITPLDPSPNLVAYKCNARLEAVDIEARAAKI